MTIFRRAGGHFFLKKRLHFGVFWGIHKKYIFVCILWFFGWRRVLKKYKKPGPKAWDEKSDARMHEHHRWAQATTAIQVAIALAAITLLTRKAWLNYASYGVSGVGILLGVLAMFHI